MLKNLVFAITPLFLFVGAAKADQDLLNELAGLDVASINDASAEIEEFDLDGLDVDQLAENAGDESDAIEACFRRFGYRHRGGWGYGFHRSYRSFCGYRSFCYPVCRPLYTCRPIVYSTYNHCYPIVTRYWGCY